MKDKCFGYGKGRCSLWLTWKLLRGQKLRTAAIFCGLLFSVYLLGSFGIFGYDFWTQVHEGAGETAGYDRTQIILISLVTVLLALVAACSGILLHNLYSLTFAQRWRSLTGLTALGAGPRDLFVMTLLENAIFFCGSVPAGWMFAGMTGKIVGIHCRLPFWLTGGILLWIGTVSFVCSIRPLWAALGGNFRKPYPRPKNIGKSFRESDSCPKNIGKSFRKPHPRPKNIGKSFRKPESYSGRCSEGLAKHTLFRNFPHFMTGKYRRANRGHHVRVVMTILAAILLYVPASYLIGTNISLQRAELDAKHGIQYGCSPGTATELEEALGECRCLAGHSDVIYVSMPAFFSVKTGELSESLRNLISVAGWREEAYFSVSGTMYFLEDGAYAGFLVSADVPSSAGSVLIDRYINRRSWSEEASLSYQEVPLLNAGKNCSGVEVYYDNSDGAQWDKAKTLIPHAVTGRIPEGLSYGGEPSLILPLSRLGDFLSPGTDYGRLYVCGKFLDLDETTFSRMETILGEDSLGSLRYTRQILQEWYASMSGIRRAMTAICSLLFFMAVLNIFCMMIFQYMERKRGLAILWSLGQSSGELLKILIEEHVRNLLAAIGLGIPMSCLLCCYIYKVFRQVWQVEFAFPLGQILLIAGAACALSLLTILVEALLMRRQDFLNSIKDLSIKDL